MSVTLTLVHAPIMQPVIILWGGEPALATLVIRDLDSHIVSTCHGVQLPTVAVAQLPFVALMLRVITVIVDRGNSAMELCAQPWILVGLLLVMETQLVASRKMAPVRVMLGGMAMDLSAIPVQM